MMAFDVEVVDDSLAPDKQRVGLGAMHTKGELRVRLKAAEKV